MQARKIPLKVLTVEDEFAPNPTKATPFIYAAHIRAAIGYGGERGMSGPDMLTAISILDEVKKSESALYLTDADWSWLSHRVRSMSWMIASRAAVQFIKDVTEAELVDVNEPVSTPLEPVVEIPPPRLRRHGGL
jgi:hypothetical protein